MNKFQEILAARSAYAEAWKTRTGGKVIGFYETYMPEEIVYAAGMLPIRLLAKHEPDDYTDRQMFGNCYGTKDILNQFVNGRYDYVDGIVHAEGCQWVFLCHQNLCNKYPGLFNHYVFVPDYPDTRTSRLCMRSELAVLKEHLEQWSGKEITEAALDDAIDVYNKNRKLLRKIYELRKSDTPPLLGSEAMEVMLACQIMDKREANLLLEDFVAELESRAPGEDRIRIMLVGSETWDVSLEKLIETAGANVVIDELDNGTSYVFNEIIPQKDRLLAIAQRYLERPHHPIKDNNWRRRPEHIFRLYEDWQADAVVISKQIYCHPHGTDNYAVWKTLRERNIPFHFFERDTTLPETETLSRIKALLSMVNPGVNRLAGLGNVGAYSTVIESEMKRAEA